MSLLKDKSLNRDGVTVAGAGATVGQVVAVTGVDSGGAVSAWGTHRPGSWGRSFVLLGNSRVALETLGPTAAPTYYQQRGVWHWVNLFLRQRCVIKNYAGVSGDTLSGMVTRWPTAVAPYAPDNVYIADAVNEMIAGLAALQGSYNTLIALNRSIGARSVIATTIPRNGWTTAQAATCAALNAWLRTLTDRDILVIDVASAVCSPTAMAWAANFATDGLHQSRIGAARQGRAIADVLDPLIPRGNDLPIYGGDPTNLVTNPFMDGTPGTGAPTGWSVFPAQGSGVTYSMVARTDQKPGNWFQADTTTTAADTFMSTAFISLSGFAAPNDQVQALIEMQSDAWTSVPGQVRLYLQLANAGGTILVSPTDGHNETTPQFGDGGDSSAYPLEVQPGVTTPVVFRTPPAVVPPTATQAKLLFEANIQGKIRLGRATIRRV